MRAILDDGSLDAVLLMVLLMSSELNSLDFSKFVGYSRGMNRVICLCSGPLIFPEFLSSIRPRPPYVYMWTTPYSMLSRVFQD